jgi:hypothetical protein
MTMLGKILVVLNFGFSLLLAIWSFTLYVNRIDWSDKPGKSDGSEPPGELARANEDLKRAWSGVRPAEASWRSAATELAQAERERALDRVWFGQQKQHALTAATAANPVTMVSYAEKADPKQGLTKGQILIDPRTGHPVMVPAKDLSDKPLASLDSYVKLDEVVSRDLIGVLQKQQDVAEQDAKLTLKLVGDQAQNIKGLQQRLQDEKKKREGVVAEQGIIKPLYVNTLVESELIFLRNDQMTARIKELEKLGLAEGR